MRSAFDRPGCRAEVCAGIFTVDAELDRVTGDDRVRIVEKPALGYAELFANEVDPRHFFRDGVFDLKTGVDLEERDGAVGSDQEFAGSRTDVTDLFENVLRCRIEQLALLVREERRWRLFNEFLVTTLQRAVTGRHDYNVALVVGQTLGLDVTRFVEVLLDETLTATESGDCLACRGLKLFGDFLARARNLETATTATERRLDGDG